MQPFLASQFRRSRAAAQGGVALIATFVALVVTDILSDGFTINGVGTWIAATVVVWVAALLAGVHPPVPRAEEVPRQRRDWS